MSKSTEKEMLLADIKAVGLEIKTLREKLVAAEELLTRCNKRYSAEYQLHDDTLRLSWFEWHCEKAELVGLGWSIDGGVKK